MNAEDIIKEVRRQGKAAVAAQAASEACLDAVEQLNRRLTPPQTESDALVDFLQALLPVFDALDRVATQAQKSRSPRNLLDRVRRSSESVALAEGVRLLHAQLSAQLKTLDIHVDRRVGVPFDPDVHRAVEVHADAETERPTVTEVVNAGYTYRGQRLREADVVVRGLLEKKP